MKRAHFLVIAGVAFLALMGQSAVQQITASFKDDFSSSSNPNVTANGTYEYRTPDGTQFLPIQTAIYLGGPPGWQDSGTPGGWTVGGLPGFPGSQFYGHAAASVDWIALFAGRLTMSGGIFKPDIPEQAERPTLVTIKLNGQVYNTIGHFPTDWDGASGDFNGSNPKPLSLGMGGAQALTFAVETGDRLSIVNDRYITGPADVSFCGFDITLSQDGSEGTPAPGTLYRANDAFDAASDTSAVSGPWSLRDDNDNLMQHQGSVFGGPPGWVSSTFGSPPAWQTVAFPAQGIEGGYLYCHAPDRNDGAVQLRWTAPADATAVIGGQISRTVFVGRNMAFEVEHNDVVITGADLPAGTGDDSGDPIQLFRMDGGSEALTIQVSAGDTIDFVTFTTSNGSGHFMRYDVLVFFSVDTGDPPTGSTTDFLTHRTLDGGGLTTATGAGLKLHGSMVGLIVAGNAFLGAGAEADDGSFLVSQYLPSLYHSLSEPTIRPPEFTRGDCNGDGRAARIDDVLFLLFHNFTGSAAPPCRTACDFNADGTTAGTTDAIVLLVHAFAGGPTLQAPYPDFIEEIRDAKSGTTHAIVQLESLPAGGRHTFDIHFQVKGNQGLLTNHASVDSSTSDPDPSNNASARNVLVEGGAARPGNGK